MQLHARAHHHHPCDSSAHPVPVAKAHRHPKSPSRQAKRAALRGSAGRAAAAPRHSSRPSPAPAVPGRAAWTGRGGRTRPQLWQRPRLRARPGQGRDPATWRTVPPASGEVAATQRHSLAQRVPSARSPSHLRRCLLLAGTADGAGCSPLHRLAPLPARAGAAPLAAAAAPAPAPERRLPPGHGPRPRQPLSGRVLPGRRPSSFTRGFKQQPPALTGAARAPVPGPCRELPKRSARARPCRAPRRRTRCPGRRTRAGRAAVPPELPARSEPAGGPAQPAGERCLRARGRARRSPGPGEPFPRVSAPEPVGEAGAVPAALGVPRQSAARLGACPGAGGSLVPGLPRGAERGAAFTDARAETSLPGRISPICERALGGTRSLGMPA